MAALTVENFEVVLKTMKGDGPLDRDENPNARKEVFFCLLISSTTPSRRDQTIVSSVVYYS